MKTIYLDNAATTMVDTDVLNEMSPYFQKMYGNSNSTHAMGNDAYNAISVARQRVADCVNTTPDKIIFTSGASEANNTILSSFPLRTLYFGSFEHPSVIKACMKNPRNVADCSSLKLNQFGKVDLAAIDRLVDGSYALLSLMFVNNETGAINDLKRVVQICHSKGILVHSDCSQALGVVPVDVKDLGVDFATFSGHKIHAPKGIGAIYARYPEMIKPLIFGGSNQEFGYRAGTENVPYIVAFGKACAIIKESTMYDLGYKRRHLFRVLKSQNPNIILNGDLNGYGKIVNVRFPNINAERLLLLLNQRGVYASKGSACHQGNYTFSPTLLSMGLTQSEVSECVRFSVSKYNTIEELTSAAKIITECAEVL